MCGSIPTSRRLLSAHRPPLRFLFFALCTCLTFLPACKKRQSPAADAPKILRVSQLNEPGDLDPATATLPDEFFIIRALSEGLVTPAPRDAQGVPRNGVLPGIADRWEMSADTLTYTFHLRPDARWSNGERVTAQDFLDSYRRALTPATGATKAPLFFMVRNARAFLHGEVTDFSKVGFRAPDDQTFQVTLRHPMPQFLLYAASGPWIPVNPRVVARHGRTWTQPANFVGNGPFTFVEWRPHQHLIVKKNPLYHGASAVHLDRIHFLMFDSNDTEERAYRGGQLDVTMTVPFGKIEIYPRDFPDEFHRTALAETRYLSFNTHRPPLNDVRVRRALSLVIDRHKIVDRVLRGGHEAAFRFLPPSLRGPNDSDGELDGASPEDREDARRLLAEAGFPKGENFPKLELTTWTTTPVVEVVQEMWKRELGIDVSIVKQDAKVHVTALREGRYDIGFATAIPDVPDAANLLQEFVSTAPGNYPHWSDARYDDLMSDAVHAPSLEREHLALRAAESRLLEQSPVAPLYFNAKNWLMSRRVRGWQHDALWTRFYLNVELIDP